MVLHKDQCSLTLMPKPCTISLECSVGKLARVIYVLSSFLMGLTTKSWSIECDPHLQRKLNLHDWRQYNSQYHQSVLSTYFLFASFKIFLKLFFILSHRMNFMGP